jgi:hypothetical protein
MNLILKSTFILFIILLAAVSVCAQPNSSGLFEEVTDTPVNGGLALMALAGIGYGFKQLKKRKG